MDSTTVIWVSYHQPDIIARGYWDQGLLEDLFERGNFEHQIGFEGEMPDGAVVVINGRTHIESEDINRLNSDLSKLRWVVLLVTGDEEGQFPFEMVRHPLIRIWMMLPRMNRHNDVSFKMPNGYRPETRGILQELGYQEKKFDWMFAGQINHERREQCLQECKFLIDSGRNKNGTLAISKEFGKEILPYRDYLSIMNQTKIVFCPSGIETPDSFRVYEALEAGCVPVVDAFATNNKDWGFWSYLFDGDFPFPVVPYWGDVQELLPQLLKDYPSIANKCFAWWQKYKYNMFNKLIEDIKEVAK